MENQLAVIQAWPVRSLIPQDRLSSFRTSSPDGYKVLVLQLSFYLSMVGWSRHLGPQRPWHPDQNRCGTVNWPCDPRVDNQCVRTWCLVRKRGQSSVSWDLVIDDAPNTMLQLKWRKHGGLHRGPSNAQRMGSQSFKVAVGNVLRITLSCHLSREE